MKSTPNKTISKTIWIVVGVAVVLILIACVLIPVVFGGAFFIFGPSRTSRPESYTISTPVPASLCKWQYLTDLPRKINTIAFDPIHPKVVYAGTGRYGESGGGVYKSEDGGASWQLAVNGLPDDTVFAIAISQDASILYAIVDPLGAIYASTDGAKNWHAVGRDEALCCAVDEQMIVQPDAPQKLIVVQPAADPNISTSQDGGATWQRIPDDHGELKPIVLALDPLQPRTMYLGSDGNGVYKSSDGGQTWVLANQGMLDYSILSLAISPADSQVIYAGSDDGYLFKTTDGGRSWKDISAGLMVKDYGSGQIRNVFIDPQSPNTVYVLAGGWSDKLLRSTDGGSTWKQFATPPNDFPAQNAMMAIDFKPSLQIILGLNYSSSDNSGGWRCVP